MDLFPQSELDLRAERMYEKIVQEFGHSEYWQIRSSDVTEPNPVLTAVRVDTGQVYTEQEVLSGRWGL